MINLEEVTYGMELHRPDKHSRVRIRLYGMTIHHDVRMNRISIKDSQDVTQDEDKFFHCGDYDVKVSLSEDEPSINFVFKDGDNVTELLFHYQGYYYELHSKGFSKDIKICTTEHHEKRSHLKKANVST